MAGLRVRVRNMSTLEEIRQCFRVREAVFQKEQGIAYQEDKDGLDFDRRTYHLGASLCERGDKKKEEIVGTLRIRILDERAFALERMAVILRERRRGVGKHLLSAAEEFARSAFRGRQLKRAIARTKTEEHRISLVLNAQNNARTFYEQFGWRVTGEAFTEAGIMHYPMSKNLLVRFP